eukprot:4920207-Prymnesium_polylepis.1
MMIDVMQHACNHYVTVKEPGRGAAGGGTEMRNSSSGEWSLWRLESVAYDLLWRVGCGRPPPRRGAHKQSSHA